MSATRRLQVVVLAVMGALALAGCSNPGPKASSTTTTASAPARSTTSTTTARSTTTPSGAAATTTTAVTGTQNLAVTDAIRQSLLAAGAASHGLTSADYTGLVAGTTYYAYDASTQTYWAAAGLDPSPNSTQAQVSSQDDGGYLLFSMAPGSSTWTVTDDGLGGIGGTPCPSIPASVVAAWGWTAGSCQPPPPVG